MQNYNAKINPLWVVSVNFDREGSVKEHIHEDYYHLVYINTGNFVFTIDGQPYSLSDNMLFIARPGQKAGWKTVNDHIGNTSEVKFAVFDNELREALQQLPNVVYGNLFIRSLLDKIIQEKDRLAYCYQEYISIYLTTLLYDLAHSQLCALQKEHAKEDTPTSSPTEMAIRYIHSNYSQELSLDSVASAIKFNKTYLSAAFKKATGDTINEYIYQYRIKMACELIAFSDLPLSQVSNMTGFKHVQHFSRVFKKYMGIAPGEYRSGTPKDAISEFRVPVFNSDVLPVHSGRLYDNDFRTGYARLKKTHSDTHKE